MTRPRSSSTADPAPSEEGGPRGGSAQGQGAGRRDRRGDKARRIMDAAIEVFAERGFFNATVAQVARQAGVADGTIYLYFKSKDDLLIQVFEDIMAMINRRLEAAVEGLCCARERLSAVAASQAALICEAPALGEVICVELRQSTKFIKEYDNPGFKTYLGILAGILEEGQATGELHRDFDPQVMARALFGAFDELHLSWILARRRRFDLAAASRQVVHVFLRGLLRDPSELT